MGSVLPFLATTKVWGPREERELDLWRAPSDTCDFWVASEPLLEASSLEGVTWDTGADSVEIRVKGKTRETGFFATSAANIDGHLAQSRVTGPRESWPVPVTGLAWVWELNTQLS